MDKENRRIRLLHGLSAVLSAFITLSLFACAAAPTPTSTATPASTPTPSPRPKLARGASLTLATFSESNVEVIIKFHHGSDGRVFLSATFTPLEAGYHLYSKDMPRYGMGGLGRPTLLELSEQSNMQTLGKLIESVGASPSMADPSGVLIYPDGPVTLTTAISLPDGPGWVADEVSLTYMACSAIACKPPVQGKTVAVKVPGTEMLSEE